LDYFEVATQQFNIARKILSLRKLLDIDYSNELLNAAIMLCTWDVPA
jgi:hypothetical protein